MGAPLLTATGFALWVAAPSYVVFAIGFVLWGAQGALRSGALEALVYAELERTGRADRYAALIGRATALGTAAACVSMGLAAPVLDHGGFAAVGAASALACVAAAVVAAGFPEPSRPPAEAQTGYAAILRAALAETRASSAIRDALIAVCAVVAVWGALDEYLPLLAVESGASAEAVPLLGLLVYAAMSAGGLVTGRAERLGPRALALVLVAAAALLAAGALVRTPPGFVLVAGAFCLLQVLTVVTGARLQHAIEGPARATVTSLSGLLTDRSWSGCSPPTASARAWRTTRRCSRCSLRRTCSSRGTSRGSRAERSADRAC